MIEVSKAVAAEAGADRTGIRISPVTPANDVSDSNPQPLFDHIVDQLNALKLVYIHVIEGSTGGPRDNAPFDYASLRKRFSGTYIANNGYDFKLATEVLDQQQSRPDRVENCSFRIRILWERLKLGAPLNPFDNATFYGGGAKGYTDYPALGQQAAAEGNTPHTVKKGREKYPGLFHVRLLRLEPGPADLPERALQRARLLAHS